jgi:hypothetical protein
MITGNVISSITPSLSALVQRIREEALAVQEFESGDSEVIGGVTKVLNEVEGILEELNTVEEKIATDETLSSLGKRQKLTLLVEQTYAKLRFVSKKAEDRQQAYTQEKATLDQVPKPVGNELVAYWREREIRDILRQLDVPKRMDVYLRGRAQNDQDLQRAVALAPLREDLLPSEFVQRVDSEYLEKTRPEQVQRLATLKRAAEWFQLLWHAVEMQMATYGRLPVFKTPPIGKMDLGLRNTQAPPDKNTAADRPPATIPAFQ